MYDILHELILTLTTEEDLFRSNITLFSIAKKISVSVDSVVLCKLSLVHLIRKDSQYVQG
jgi:hypothetical protein